MGKEYAIQQYIHGTQNNCFPDLKGLELSLKLAGLLYGK